jgi:holliday junction DNA helicase RuvA
MIAYIDGKLAEKAPTHVVIDCNGVGYLIKISLHTYGQIQQAVDKLKLYTYYQVREDAHVLYGFAEMKEKNLFELLISVSGIGGNTALTILSGMSPSELGEAIRSQKTNVLKGVKGIGPKTAERMVLELKDKISPELTEGAGSITGTASTPVKDARKKEEAVTALVQLGFNRTQVEAKVNDILKKQPDMAIADLIRMAMKG